MMIVPQTIREANAFVAQFHRHNKPTSGGKFALGVGDEAGLIGVAIVGRPIARRLNDAFTAEVLRTCCRPDAQLGANSMLYGACWRAWRAMGGTKLVTYTLQAESGASLRGAGWKIIGEVKPCTWNRTARFREWQPIYGQAKFRWEVTD